MKKEKAAGAEHLGAHKRNGVERSSDRLAKRPAAPLRKQKKTFEEWQQLEKNQSIKKWEQLMLFP